MAHIDSLLTFIVQKEAQTGWLLSDAPSQFATPSGTQAGPTLTSAQIQALVTEIAPEPARVALQETGAAQFEHASSLGTFMIHAQRNAEQWQVAVSPQHLAPAPPQTPQPAYGAADPNQGYYQPQGQYPHAYPQGGYPQGPYAGQGAPPYGAPPIKPSRSTGATIGIICAIGCGGMFFVGIILAAILFPVFARARENARRASCQSNLKQLSLATLEFAQDHQERYPTGTTMSQWQPQLMVYAKSQALFRCPSEPDAEGYEINPKLSGISLSKLPYPAGTAVMYEHKGRHLEGCNIAFADGHVKWYRDSEADSIINAPVP